MSELEEGIWIICVTGGPCAGKTTGLTRLNRLLTDRGYKVLISPESATKLIIAGMKPGELDDGEFQEEILLDTLHQEERLISIARKFRAKGRKVVVLCDSGAMDGLAYTTRETFETIRLKYELRAIDLSSLRYHAVMHMRTAALGAEKYYTLANNEARHESLEDAKALDQRRLNAWLAHHHPMVIDNSTDFDGKMHRLFCEICAVLGDPVPIEKEDKFLIEHLDPKDLPVTWVESNIVQNYLHSPVWNEERRVRSRSDAEGTCYYYTIKRSVMSGERIEIEKMITNQEYRSLLTYRNPKSIEIRKKRVCFFWNEQFFEIDLFQNPKHIGGSYSALMEVERTDRTPELQLPPFIKVIRNVTGEREFSNSYIAGNV